MTTNDDRPKGKWVALPEILAGGNVWQAMSLTALRVFGIVCGVRARTWRSGDSGVFELTHSEIKKMGIHNNAVGPALRELEAAGIIERVRKGYGGEGCSSQASLYRLTFLGEGDHAFEADPSIDEWRSILKAARDAKDTTHAHPRKPRERTMNDVKSDAPEIHFASRVQHDCGTVASNTTVEGGHSRVQHDTAPSIPVASNATITDSVQEIASISNVGGGSPHPAAGLCPPPPRPSPSFIWAAFSPSRFGPPSAPTVRLEPSPGFEPVADSFVVGGKQIELPCRSPLVTFSGLGRHAGINPPDGPGILLTAPRPVLVENAEPALAAVERSAGGWQ